MFQEQTKQLMRPTQVRESRNEIERIESMLQAPPHIANQIQDRGELARQLRSLNASLEHQAPKPYREEELDAATKREQELRESWMTGMPTQAEMRRNPAGARDKHMKWEKANKLKILEWKNIKRRLHANGYGGVEETDIANIEVYRPQGASHELNMHNEQIAGTLQFGPTPSAGQAVVFADAEADLLKTVAPEISEKLAVMSNEQRQMVKDFIDQQMGMTDTGDSNVNVHAPAYQGPVEKPKRKKREYTAEERKAIGERLRAAREAKKEG